MERDTGSRPWATRPRTQHRYVFGAILVAGACLQTPGGDPQRAAATEAAQSSEPDAGTTSTSGSTTSESIPVSRTSTDRLAAPRPVQPIVEGFALEISKPDDENVLIEWADQEVEEYEVWGSSDPYFEPGDPGSVMLWAGTELEYGTSSAWEAYYRVVAPGAEEELSTTVGQIPYELYKNYTKLGVCLVSEVDYWPELEADMPSEPSNAFMWDASIQEWVYGWFLSEVQIDPGEVISILHDDHPDPSFYTWVGHVPTDEDVGITLLPGDNLVTTVPLAFGPIMTSDLLELVDYGQRIGSWNPVTQTTRWHPDDGDWLLPTCSPVHVEVSDESEWPPAGGNGSGGGEGEAEGEAEADDDGNEAEAEAEAGAEADAEAEAEAEAEGDAEGDGEGDADGEGEGGDDGDDLPPDPENVAPPLDTTVTTQFFDSVSFLFEGEAPIQAGVAPGTITEQRVAVLRGSVSERGGDPLGGVEVSVLGHPEYGTTLTRADGRYDLAVNGGGPLVLVFVAEDWLTAQRHTRADWQEFIEVGPVALVAVDAEVSLIEFEDPIEMHVATPVSDADGSRTAVVLFRDETVATMVLPNDSTSVLESLNIRATEYTVGAEGPAAMPATLPPTSAYTYAIAYTIDEAETAGAVRVDLDPPAIAYVENFIGFPVGENVPFGAYNFMAGAWEASPDGRIIEITSTSGGVAAIDLTGDGIAENTTALTAAGIDTDERTALASQYASGTELWRMPVPHMSSWDANWGFAPPDGAGPPPNGPMPDPQPDDDPGCDGQPGSVIDCDSQILGEDLAIAGTPFTLSYRSDRVPGRRASYQLRIPLLREFLAQYVGPFEQARVVVDVAGRHFEDGLTYAEVLEGELGYLFEWDGVDVYGRRPQGPARALACVHYDYPVQYHRTLAANSRSFGYNGNGESISGSRQASVLSFTRCHFDQLFRSVHGGPYLLGTFDATRGAQALGGWTLSPHHTLYPEHGVVYLGTGKRIDGAFGFGARAVEHVAGGGSSANHDGDGGPAATARIAVPMCGAMGPDGSIYICDGHRVRRIDPGGTMRVFAGDGTAGFSGDNGPASVARLNSVRSVAIAPEGSVYIADFGNRRVRRVATDGTITTIAGNGALGALGDNGPATSAQLGSVAAVATAEDGTLYVAQSMTPGRIRRIGIDGIITTVVGGGSCGSIEGEPAQDICLQGTESVVIARDGTIYFSYRTASTFIDGIYRVGTDGIVHHVAGAAANTAPARAEGIDAREAWLDNVQGIAVSESGLVYFADTARQLLRYVDLEGNIHTIAGSGGMGPSAGDDGPALLARLAQPRNAFVGHDDAVYFLEQNGGRLRRAVGVLPGGAGGDADEILVPSPDGGEVWVFDLRGRHLRTQHAITGTLRHSFGYDEDGRLTTITDGYAAQTEIERDGSGVATAIVGPDGHETLLDIGTSGYLESITNPAGETYELGYSTDGLLTGFTAPPELLHTFDYDEDGRLELDTDAEDGSMALSREQTGLLSYSVDVSTALERTRTVAHSVYPGDEDTLPSETTSITLADGTENRRVTYPDARQRYTFGDGMEVRREYSPDSRFGMRAPLVRQETETPNGLVLVQESQRSVTTSLFEVTSAVQTSRRNGRATISEYDRATDTWTVTSPAGREFVGTIDAHDRPIEIQAPGLETIFLDYDARGRLETATMGMTPDERTWTLVYDEEGELASTEDPAGRVTEMTRDSVGRVLEVLGPDLETTELDYDDRGNLTEVTPPDRTVHTLVYDADDRQTAYTPPDLGVGTEATQYVYDEDDALVQVLRPNSQVIDFDYDGAGRLETVVAPHGNLSVSYDEVTGQVSEVEAPDGNRILYSYDGRLLTEVEAIGSAPGTITFEYDDDFRVVSETIEAVTFEYDYDSDGLLTAAGAVTIARDAPTGWPNTIAAGDVATALDFDTFGELTSMASDYDSAALLSFVYERDALGRIVSIAATVDAVTTTTEYTYDAASRLETVTVDNVEVFEFGYDGNGNRSSITTGSGTVSADFDAQDRLVELGTIELEYAVTGELLSRTEGLAVTQYEHDAFGALVAVELPDSTLIEYDVDARGRRVGKRVDDVLERAWLYHDQLDPAAELDDEGNVVARFVYGSLPHTPDLVLRDGNTYRVLTDHLGSVRMVVDIVTGTVAQELQYGPWGEVLLDTNPGFQPFGFAGGLYDPDTGLVSFGAREYDATLGRWISRDPALFDGGMNLFAYAANDPINLVDASGRSPSPSPIPGGDPGPANDGDYPANDGRYPKRPVRLPRIHPLVNAFLDALQCGLSPTSCGLPDFNIFEDPQPEPGGFCPAAPYSEQPEGAPYRRSAKERCRDACHAGGEVLKAFCRSLDDTAARGRCWSKVNESVQKCENWCHYEF